MHTFTTKLGVSVSFSTIIAIIIREFPLIHTTCTKAPFPQLARKIVHGQPTSNSSVSRLCWDGYESAFSHNLDESR